MNIKQIVAALIAVFSVLAVSTTNLTDIFGPTLAKSIASASNMINAILAGWLGVLTGQAATVKEVAAMPGIEPLKINADANRTLARIALDENVEKVDVVPQDKAAIVETAKN